MTDEKKETTEEPKKLIYLNRTYQSLKMVVKHGRRFKDTQGNPVEEKGTYIQFVNGRFETDDPELQAYLKEYSKKNQNEIHIEDPEIMERDQRIHKLAKEMIEKEDAKAGRGLHGVEPKDVDLDSQEPDGEPGTLPTNTEIKLQKKIDKMEEDHAKKVEKLQNKIDKDKAKSEEEIQEETDQLLKRNHDKIDKLNKNQISKDDLFALAEDFGVELDEPEKTDHQHCRDKVSKAISEYQIPRSPNENEEPNLEDESKNQ